MTAVEVMPYDELMSERGRISPEQIQDLKTRVDLRTIAAYYVTLRGGYEKYGACPRCGGKDRLHLQPHVFFCRNCLPPDLGQGRHDVFDFALFIGEAQSFKEAVMVVANWANSPFLPVRADQPLRSYQRVAPSNWQAATQTEVKRCQQRLLSRQGELGRAYLTGRGLMPATWDAGKLGLAWRRDAEGQYGWAIALPWLYGNQVTGIQYRFIDEREQRYTRFGLDHYYGETRLYTLPQKGGSSLVTVEGEINGLSVWQATDHDVVSFGSENMTTRTIEALQKVVGSYRRVAVWADKPAVAQDLIATLGRTAEAISTDYDANELLQRGELRNFLA